MRIDYLGFNVTGRKVRSSISPLYLLYTDHLVQLWGLSSVDDGDEFTACACAFKSNIDWKQRSWPSQGSQVGCANEMMLK